MAPSHSIPMYWFVISGLAFLLAIAVLVTCGYILFRLLAALFPLLDETHRQVQDLGGIAAHTLDESAQTLDIVQAQLTHALGEASSSGKSTARQAVGIGTVAAVGYAALRMASRLRQPAKRKTRAKKRRSWLPWSKKR